MAIHHITSVYRGSKLLGAVCTGCRQFWPQEEHVNEEGRVDFTPLSQQTCVVLDWAKLETDLMKRLGLTMPQNATAPSFTLAAQSHEVAPSCTTTLPPGDYLILAKEGFLGLYSPSGAELGRVRRIFNTKTGEVWKWSEKKRCWKRGPMPMMGIYFWRTGMESGYAPLAKIIKHHLKVGMTITPYRSKIKNKPSWTFTAKGWKVQA